MRFLIVFALVAAVFASDIEDGSKVNIVNEAQINEIEPSPVSVVDAQVNLVQIILNIDPNSQIIMPTPVMIVDAPHYDEIAPSPVHIVDSADASPADLIPEPVEVAEPMLPEVAQIDGIIPTPVHVVDAPEGGMLIEPVPADIDGIVPSPVNVVDVNPGDVYVLGQPRNV